MFEKVGPNRVRSSWGFEVSVRGHATQLYVEYKENGHLLGFDNTMNLGSPRFSLCPRYIKRWSSPFEEEPLSAEKRKQIIENMVAAMDYLGITCDARDEQGNVIGSPGGRGWVWKDEKWLNT